MVKNAWKLSRKNPTPSRISATLDCAYLRRSREFRHVQKIRGIREIFSFLYPHRLDICLDVPKMGGNWVKMANPQSYSEFFGMSAKGHRKLPVSREFLELF